MKTKLMEDESGVNIIIEYMLNLAIVMVLFTIIILTYQSMVKNNSDHVMNQEFEIYANDLANRIVNFDTLLSSSPGLSGSVMQDSFEMPTQITGRSYYINVIGGTAGSANAIEIYTLDNTSVAPVKISFITNNPVQSTLTSISSSSLYHNITYTSGQIVIT